MISFLSSWAEQVILAVIIATILELILPNSKNKNVGKWHRPGVAIMLC